VIYELKDNIFVILVFFLQENIKGVFFQSIFKGFASGINIKNGRKITQK